MKNETGITLPKAIAPTRLRWLSYTIVSLAIMALMCLWSCGSYNWVTYSDGRQPKFKSLTAYKNLQLLAAWLGSYSEKVVLRTLDAKHEPSILVVGFPTPYDPKIHQKTFYKLAEEFGALEAIGEDDVDRLVQKYLVEAGLVWRDEKFATFWNDEAGVKRVMPRIGDMVIEQVKGMVH